MSAVSRKVGAFALAAMLTAPAALSAQAQAPYEGEAGTTVYGNFPEDLSGLTEGPEIEGVISARSASRMQVTSEDGSRTVLGTLCLCASSPTAFCH